MLMFSEEALQFEGFKIFKGQVEFFLMIIFQISFLHLVWALSTLNETRNM